MNMDNERELKKQKEQLRGTIYGDFVKTLSKNSIYKSIRIRQIDNGTAYYETEPYDDAYKVANDEQFYETCKKIERAFKKYHKDIFSKYNVNNIVVDIYDEWSCSAGLIVYPDGTVDPSNF